jgi:putative hemolysin
MLAELIVVLALILANGVLSGAEIAVVSLRRTRVEQLLDEKRTGAEALAGLRAQPERFLATVQIGITVIGTTAAAFGGSALARHIQPLIARIDWMASERSRWWSPRSRTCRWCWASWSPSRWPCAWARATRC